MKETLNVLNIKGEMKTEEIYNLLKTNSKKINSEISKKIKSFKKIDDFFNHYSYQTSLFELLNKVEFNSSKNYDEIFSSFDLNIEQYISCFTQIIISIKLILKTQEILNKIFLSSKQYLTKLKIQKQVENISQENLFFFIENLLFTTQVEIPRTFSDSTSLLKFDESDRNLLVYHQKYINEQILKSFSSIDIRKNLKILNKESCITAFCLKSDKNIENREKKNCQNMHTIKESSLTISGGQKFNLFNDNKNIVKDRINNSITQNVLYNNTMNKKKYENLLEMINNIYKKCIINSEEKIRLKLLVIAKSKKLENFYYNTYKKKFINEKVLRAEIAELIK